jgi:hypothetical protein
MLIVLAYTISEANSISNTNLKQENSFSQYAESKMPELDYYDNYLDLRPTTKDVVVYPIFTQSAYQWGAMHDFYAGYCDSCLNATIQDYYEKIPVSSGNGYRILEFLGYEIINDVDIDKNPSILDQYDKVILLHNEFVTKTEFEAIKQHPKVIYLYPHALSSEVQTDYSNNSITLIRGPGFPDKNIVNGFDWEFDNSEYFDDWSCLDWRFYEISNGYMLNCYPETELPHYGYEILKKIKSL